MSSEGKTKRLLVRYSLVGCGVVAAVVAMLVVVFAVALSPGANGFDSPHHPFRSAEAKREVLASYDARASRWPVPPNIAALSEHYRTYAVDIVGDHGRSIYTRQLESAGDYSVWLDELLDALGLEQDVYLAGLSYGGWIAARYAVHSPDRLRKVVLLAPAGTISPIPFDWIWRAVLVALPHRTFVKNFLYWMLEDLAQTDGGGRILDQATDAAYLAIQSYKPRPMAPPDVLTDAELQSLTMPVLFTVGENEKLYSATEAVERLNEVAPKIQTRVVPGAGHDFTILQADLVNRLVIEFLDE